MGKLKYLIIHCTATPEGREITSDQIRRMHMMPKFDKKSSRYTYRGKLYKKIADLPNEEIGGMKVRDYVLKYGGVGRGWDRLGYSDMIHLDGTIENLTPYDEDNVITQHEMTWGATGINSYARHIVYAGGTDAKGKPKDTLTESQFMALQGYIKEFLYKHTDCLVGGHNQFAHKACPSFDVPDKLSLMSIPEKNIYKPAS